MDMVEVPVEALWGAQTQRFVAGFQEIKFHNDLNAYIFLKYLF
jgi:fumarate hydratase class II